MSCYVTGRLVQKMPCFEMATTGFDLFGGLSNDEEKWIEHRRKNMQDTVAFELSKLPASPEQRSTEENRRVFNHVRRQRFTVPVTIRGLLTRQECRDILEQCRGLSAWTTSRHSAFPTTDIPLLSSDTPFPSLLVEQQLRQRLLPRLASYYGFHPTRGDLDFRDLFIVKYAADAQRGLDLHTDGCLISFNILLSHENDFQGGGTFFASIGRTLRLQQGDCVHHDARIMHSGTEITQGERYILVGFVDTKDTIVNDKTVNRMKRSIPSNPV